jgi:hypothetical protein
MPQAERSLPRAAPAGRLVPTIRPGEARVTGLRWLGDWSERFERVRARSISRSIVENHGGRLRVVPGDGPGATFQFSVPERP